MRYTNFEREFKEKISKIKLICMDVDGVLTDGGIYLDHNGNQIIRFDVKDGLGIRLLQKYSTILILFFE